MSLFGEDKQFTAFRADLPGSAIVTISIVTDFAFHLTSLREDTVILYFTFYFIVS